MRTQNELPEGAFWNYYSAQNCSLADFADVIAKSKVDNNAQFADQVSNDIVIYDAVGLRKKFEDQTVRHAIYSEWSKQLETGCGVIVIKQAFTDLSIVDEATAMFQEIIETERGKNGADHFAKKGANDRVWNALEKLCLKDPDLFARYYSNDMVAALSSAWLGPNYQMTSQINVVRPGGEAQQPHRDYHLGFQSEEAAASYPAQVHHFSHFLTLQGAIAHCDMPLVSGPTKLLPYSQNYKPGYMAYRREDFRDYFENHHVQLPLEKGDLLFFSPALFHAAGHNKTEDVFRMANLLQVSSAYGIALEAVDRARMSKALYPKLLAHKTCSNMSETDIINAVACCADGYSFPTNLDSDPPVGGLVPKTQQALMLEGLESEWSAEKFVTELDTLQARRKS